MQPDGQLGKLPTGAPWHHLTNGRRFPTRLLTPSVATLPQGYTDENDGMDGQQPRDTFVLRNYVHEFAHYQKQSSMWSNNKACLAQVEGNVVFNGPRVRHPAPSYFARYM